MPCNLPKVVLLDFTHLFWYCLSQTNGILAYFCLRIPFLPPFTLFSHCFLLSIPISVPTGLLVEAESLAMGLQVTIWPELPIMNWMLLTHQAIKLNGHNCTPSSHGWYVQDWAWTGPECTSWLHEEVAQIPMVPIPATLTSFPSLLL